MQKSLLANTIINWITKNKTERILWVDSASDSTFTFDIMVNTYSPLYRRKSDIVDGLKSGDVIILDKDPWVKFIVEKDIKANGIVKRDRAWAVVSYIIDSCGEPDIYNPTIRSIYIKQASIKFDISVRSIYDYLKKYWQRGKVKNALLPDFKNCGGKGVEKKAGDKKRGRPRKSNKVKGVNVDGSTKVIFQKSIKKFYLTTKENSLVTAYELMRKNYYSDGFRFDGQVKKPLLMDSSKTPSFGQFKYWYFKQRNIKKEVSGRKSTKRYFLENREVLGNSTQEAFGVGEIYLIDATIMNLYVKSSYTNNSNDIIGRPILYTVIDVYSHMIVGIYVGLEGPSWLGAMIALSNATMDKVEFCGKYDISITEAEWPVSNVIPQSILADRGEMEGKNAENLVNGLNIKLSNTASFRGDLKPLVERYYATIHATIKPHVSGYVGGDFNMRGSKDYRLEAELTIPQLTRILIKCVLYYNNHHWMDTYKRVEMMVEDEISPIPIIIWTWSISNTGGKLRRVSQDTVRFNLMPRNTATVTGRGIKFKGIFYGSSNGLKEHWFVKAKNEGSWKVEVSYDPQNMDYIYILLDGEHNVEKCSLLNSEDRYKNKTIEEIDYLLDYEKMKSHENRDRQLQSKVDLMADIESIVKEAKKQTEEVRDTGVSKAKRLKGIGENRAKEKLINREQEYWEIGEQSKANNADANLINDEENYSFGDDICLIKKMQKERLKNE